MNYLNKLLAKIQDDPTVFQKPDVNYIVGLTSTQLAKLKKQARADKLIKEIKRKFYLTEAGEKYLQENPVPLWVSQEFPKHPEINLEYLKLEKAPPILTKAIRNLARHLLEDEVLKENSTEDYLVRELLSGKIEARQDIEDFVLNKDLGLTCLFERFSSVPYGLTKSIISVLLLDILAKNKDLLAIYENGRFQLKLDALMFDRICVVPHNFEIKKTVMENLPVIEELSAVVLPCKSKNILDITKGLIAFIRSLDKYTLNTERLSKPAVRFRNTIVNAKDPINLFCRDIPKTLCDKILCQCGDELVQRFDDAVQELQNAYPKLIEELTGFLFDAFSETQRSNLAARFEVVKDYIANDELKIFYNNVKELDSFDTRWIEKIAMSVNKSRAPQDWSDNDIAGFKLKVKQLAQEFLIVEATIGNSSQELDGLMAQAFDNVIALMPTQQEKMCLAWRLINGQ